MPRGPALAPVFDQVGDRDHLEPVPPGHADQLRHTSHGSVRVHDLAEHAGRKQAGEAGEINRRLGVTGALEHPALLGAEREHVAWHVDVLVPRGRFGDGPRCGRV